MPHVRLAVENRLAVGYRLQVARLKKVSAAGGRAYGIQAFIRLVDINVVSVQKYWLEANADIRTPVGLADYFRAVFAQIREGVLHEFYPLYEKPHIFVVFFKSGYFRKIRV